MEPQNASRDPDVGESPSAGTLRVAELTYLWDEYKYRHGLCWSAVYKVTAVVFALGALPYSDTFIKWLGADMSVLPPVDMLIVPPALGTALALFSVFFVHHEIAVFQKTKLAYRTLQDQFYKQAINSRDVVEQVLQGARSASPFSSPFYYFVMVFLGVLVVLSAVNWWYVAARY